MKNWNYIEGAKVGNESLAAHPDTKVAQEIYKTYLDAGKDENKTLEILAAKYKPIPRNDLKRHIKEAIEAYSKMVKNSKTGNAGITDKEFNSESDLRRWCMDHGYTYTPVGGGYYRLENDKPGSSRPDIEAHVKAGNRIGNEKTGVEGFFKKLAKDVDDREKKDNEEIEKVGNFKTGNSIGGGVQSETVLTEAKDGSQFWVEKTSKSGQYAQYNLYYTIGQGKRHAGVFKDKEAAADAGRRIIGNKIPVRPGFTKEEEFFIRYPGANSREHLLKLIELAKKEGLSKEFIEDMEHDLKSWKVKNSSSNEEYWKKQYIEAARKKGVPERDIQEFIKKIEKEGAKGVLIPVKNIASEYEILKQDPSKMHPLYKKAYEEAMKKLAREDEEFKKRFEKEYGVKAKNEASDDKFAYVMREFDEGKLKTPDGKVVTDPAQAKAIAYSESKKTENGLARARNAIKKS